MLKKMAYCTLVMCVMCTACKETTVEGTGAKKLTLVKPMDTSVKQGQTTKISIAVKRTGFDGPVTVDITDLPKGVTLVDNAKEIEGNEKTVVISASDAADLVSNHRVNVSVRGPDGMTATEQFSLTVRQKS